MSWELLIIIVVYTIKKNCMKNIILLYIIQNELDFELFNKKIFLVYIFTMREYYIINYYDKR